MQTTTLAAVQALLQQDTEVTPQQVAAALRAATATNAPRRRLGTKREAAAILSTHPETCKRWGRKGWIDTVKLGPRKLRFDLDQCERIANEGLDAVLASKGEVAA